MTKVDIRNRFIKEINLNAPVDKLDSIIDKIENGSFELYGRKPSNAHEYNVLISFALSYCDSKLITVASKAVKQLLSAPGAYLSLNDVEKQTIVFQIRKGFQA